MSFRHTYITEFLYKGTEESRPELQKISDVLDEYGTVKWEGGGMPGLGYFHGVIKDSDSFSSKEHDKEVKDKLKELGVRIEIIYE